MLYAWPKVAKHYPDCHPAFFGQHAKFLVEAEMDGTGILLPGPKPFLEVSPNGNPGRSREIRLGGFDAFVIVGLAFGPIGVFRTYRRYHYFGLAAKRPQALSRENFKRAARQLICDGAGARIATLIRKAQPDRPVLLVTTPVPSEKGYLDDVKPNMEPWKTAHKTGDSRLLLEMYGELASEVASQGVTIIQQPAETLASPLSTRQVFADGAVRLQAEGVRGDDDYEHMNVDYGAVVWQHVMSKLSSAK